MSISRRTLLGLAVLAAAVGCSGSEDEAFELRLATGLYGGPYRPLGDRLAQELRSGGMRVKAMATAASVENLTMMTDGRADAGFALADSADDAVRVRHQPVAALARMYMNYAHLVVSRDSAISTVQQLAGKVVSIGVEGSGTAVTAVRVLAAAGLADPPEMVKGGVPTPALTTRDDVRLVSLESLVPVLRREFGPVYEEASVPAGTYGGTRSIRTVGTPSYLMCRSSLSDDLAFTITETLFSARDRLQAPSAPGGRLDERYAIGTGVVPLHPGAARYYRSVYG